MEIKQIGSRGVMFTFEDENSIYLIDAGNKVFLCDTHEGPATTGLVQQYLDENHSGKEIIIFNSHSDFDHNWGNSLFANATIIGHETSIKRLTEEGEYDYERYTKRHQGQISLKAPNLLFAERLHFDEEGVEFIYAPGHTIDSAICFDRKDSVLYVGDLVENPRPYLLHDDLSAFVSSLELIKSLPATTIISSHSGIIDGELIEANLQYVRNCLMDEQFDFHSKVSLEDEYPQVVHNINLKNLLFFKYQAIARQKLGAKFDYRNFRRGFWISLGLAEEEMDREFRFKLQVDYEVIEDGLKRYIEQI